MASSPGSKNGLFARKPTESSSWEADMATVLCIGGETLSTRHALLKNAGFDVLTATSECVSLALGGLPTVDAVIMDSRAAVASLPEIATELKCSRPTLPVVLVTDWGGDDAPRPTVAFDRVLCRLDGPAVLLQVLRELITGAVATSRVNREWTRETRSRSRQLREGMAEMRQTMRRTRVLSEEAQQRKLNRRK
jgi:DNA-binding NarL/FixJ family response regulator